MTTSARHIAYLSLQAVVDGQDSWAAVTEVIGGMEADGWTVDRYFVEYRGGAAGSAWQRLVEMWRVQRRLARRIGEYDALYVRGHPMAWPTSRRARRKGVPVVQECNGPYEDLFIAWPALRVARPIFEAMQCSQYRSAAAIVAVSAGLTEWVRAECGNERVVTNGNGANIVAFNPDAPRRASLPARYAVFFGQFAAWQGIATLIEAVRSPEWPDELALLFVGDGVERLQVTEAVARTPKRVVYLGQLPYKQVAEVVAHSVASLVPVMLETGEVMHSPLKLYESMACGVPVIASDTAGIREVVAEHECGLLVAPGDAKAIARALTELVADPERAAEMGRRGHEAAVARYSWRARARQRESVVEQAIERTKREHT